MASSNSRLFYCPLLLLVASFLSSQSSVETLGFEPSGETGRSIEGFGRRLLLSFKETPSGSNATYECSPSGPCVACLYSEKNDKRYRCSETGYRIPLKCTEIQDVSKKTNAGKSQNSRSALENSYDEAKSHVVLREADLVTSGHRWLLDEPLASKSGLQAYITYRSCITPASEEKLSVIGFEGIVLCLLILSGSAIYFRRKRVAVMPGVGAGRIQMNRF